MGSSDPPVGQTTLSPEEYYKFESEDDLLAWVLSLPGIDDELSEEDSSPSASDVSASPSASDVSASPSGTSDASASPHLPPPPIFAAQDDRINTVPTGAQLPHSIPRPARCAHIVRGPTRRTVDTEDLRKDVVNNRRRHWYVHARIHHIYSVPNFTFAATVRYFAEDTAAFPTLYERDLPPCDTPGTPPRNIDERMKLEPLASAYKYTLDPDRTTSLATCRDYSSSEDEGANGYSATELFGPDAETVKVARCAPVRPRASIDLCELTTVEHTLRHRTGKTTEPSSRLKMYADPCAVEYWKASVNEVVEYVRAEKAKEERARLAAELAAFFEDAAAGDDDDDEDDDDEGMKAVEIPDLKEEAEADALFDAENDSDGTGSESSNEEDGRLFDFDQWVADCLLL